MSHEVEARGTQLGQPDPGWCQARKSTLAPAEAGSSLLAPLAPSLLHFIPGAPEHNWTRGRAANPSLARYTREKAHLA